MENPTDYTGININEFPMPDRSDIYVDADDYEFDATKEVFHISTSRGCPYHCTYCVNCKNNYWLVRNEDNVIEELRREFVSGNYKYINFVDCNITLGIESNSKKVLDRYKKGTSPEINQKAI